MLGWIGVLVYLMVQIILLFHKFMSINYSIIKHHTKMFLINLAFCLQYKKSIYIHNQTSANTTYQNNQTVQSLPIMYITSSNQNFKIIIFQPSQSSYIFQLTKKCDQIYIYSKSVLYTIPFFFFFFDLHEVDLTFY